MFFQKPMPEEKSTLDAEYFKKRYRGSDLTKEEKEIGLIGRTCHRKIKVLSYIHFGFKKCWFPTRYVTQESL